MDCPGPALGVVVTPPRRKQSMKRLRVMHVVAGGDIGGAERLADLFSATRPEKTGADHQVALFTPNRALAAYFGRAGIALH